MQLVNATTRKRVCPQSPLTSLLTLFDRNARLQQPNPSSSDRASVTEESNIIMPKEAPRVKLCQELTKHKFVEGLHLERQNLKAKLLKMLLMRVRVSRQGKTLDLTKGVDRAHKRPSFISKLLFQLSLLEYHNNNTQQSQRLTVVVTLLSERYLSVRMPLPKSFNWLNDVLPRSPDHIFAIHTRMSRRSFGMLVQLLELRAPQFFKSARGRRQLPIHIQLHLALFCLGYYGNGASHESARAKFGYGVGTIQNARRRVVQALVSLASEYIRWPTPSQRRALCRDLKAKHGFHSAFFIVDGTTHNFAFVPSYERNSWFDRKSNYSMQALVTCDANLRVIHLVVGWPGSTHDARVMRSADYMLEENEDEYFTGEQHGLGDAAFGIHKRVVPNYKEPLASIPENREYNLCHSSLRVRSEHTIGHVKVRFQGLREVRMRVAKKKDVLDVVKFITAGYVLHNILLDFKDDWNSPAEELNRAREDEATLRAIQQTALPEDLEITETGVLFREKVKRQVLQFIGYQDFS